MYKFIDKKTWVYQYWEAKRNKWKKKDNKWSSNMREHEPNVMTRVDDATPTHATPGLNDETAIS